MDASLPELTIEIDGEPDSVLDVLKDLGEGAAFVETLPAPAPEQLDETEELSAALIDEYETRFGERPVFATVACPIGGVMAGALFVLSDWAEFDDRCNEAVSEPAPPSDEQIDEWAALCAEDDAFRRRGAQQRPGIVRGIVGPRVSSDVIPVVERAALDRMASTIGVKAVEMRAAGSSKEAIRVGLGVSGPLVEEWLAPD